MMGVREETVIVKDRAAGRRAALESIAAVVAFFVNIRQELRDCVLNRICTAERADDAVLCGRVSLLFSESVKRLSPPRGDRPLRGVMPVNIALELLVYVKPGAVRELIPLLGDVGERRPVHKPMPLIGGIVAHVNTDVLRDLSRNCRVFFG